MPDDAADVALATGNPAHVIPTTLPMLQPILSILPLQLFATNSRWRWGVTWTNRNISRSAVTVR